MSKEVAKKQESAVSTDVVQWGEDVNVGKDLLLSKVLMMQGLSDMVANDGAKMGELRDSITKELLGDAVTPVAFVPFHVRKMWDISEEVDDKFEWIKSVPVVEDPTAVGYNDNWEWTAVVDGVNQKRVRRLDFFCLLAKQIEAGSAIPVTVSFRSTSYKAGQVLLNQMYVRNKMVKKSPAAVVMALGGEKVKNEKGTFFTMKATPLRDATAAEQNAALEWYKIIRGANVVVDESDSKADAPVAAAQGDQSAGRF